MTTPLEQAVQLRQAGQAEQALGILLDLHAALPGDPSVNYQCAWTLDSLGRETEAIPFYERALAGGLAGDDRRGALLGLGSTYRCVGEFEKAAATLRQGQAAYPEAREFQVFLAMALYNLGDARAAMETLLRNLAETTGDAGLAQYRGALLFYAAKLDQTWA